MINFSKAERDAILELAERVRRIEEPRKRIGFSNAIQEDGSLSGDMYDCGWYLSWSPNTEDGLATLDGRFSVADLIAIANYMLSHSKQDDP